MAEQGYLAPQDRQLSCCSCCPSLYALALMFPPKLSSHTHLSLSGSLELAAEATEAMRAKEAMLAAAAGEKRGSRLTATRSPAARSRTATSGGEDG